MNHQDVIDMAEESGLTDKDLGPGMTDYGDSTEQILKFAALVAEKEREACINQIKLQKPLVAPISAEYVRMQRLIEAIRSRGQQ